MSSVPEDILSPFAAEKDFCTWTKFGAYNFTLKMKALVPPNSWILVRKRTIFSLRWEQISKCPHLSRLISMAQNTKPEYSNYSTCSKKTAMKKIRFWNLHPSLPVWVKPTLSLLWTHGKDSLHWMPLRQAVLLLFPSISSLPCSVSTCLQSLIPAGITPQP